MTQFDINALKVAPEKTETEVCTLPKCTAAHVNDLSNLFLATPVSPKEKEAFDAYQKLVEKDGVTLQQDTNASEYLKRNFETLAGPDGKLSREELNKSLLEVQTEFEKEKAAGNLSSTRLEFLQENKEMLQVISNRFDSYSQRSNDRFGTETDITQTDANATSDSRSADGVKQRLEIKLSHFPFLRVISPPISASNRRPGKAKIQNQLQEKEMGINLR